ncbi:MAG: biopolymer transporter ExbD [Gammaproteobacteria bacterium]|nr:biopolymer transporter ExbD [Gammaproteobacteria bacterium]
MRKRSSITSEDEATIDMTPMLDVVFIMLIFFIVTSSFVKEAGIDVFKPIAETAEPKQLTSLLIAINKANEVWIDRRNIERSMVKPVIEKLYAENPKGAVVIQADKDSDSESVMFVMNAAREAGVADIAVAATVD